MNTITKNRDIQKYYVKQTPIEFINDNTISGNADTTKCLYNSTLLRVLFRELLGY